MTSATPTDAANRLHDLIERAAASLDAPDRRTWLVAEGPIPATEPDQEAWLYRVHLGPSYWQRSWTITPDGRTKVMDHSGIANEFTPEQVETSASQLASQDLPIARRVLHGLQTLGWRDAAEAANLLHGPVLCLTRQQDRLWVYSTDLEAKDGRVWIWVEGRGFVPFGTCIDLRTPLWFRSIEETALANLSPEVAREIRPDVRDAAALRRLSDLVKEAARQAAAITDQPLALCSKESRWNTWDDGGYFRMRQARIF